mmetsp:Transcript_61323/g.72831  ORF Transcript_61323/g.72831 Transcript_61323/m.72831 type:complete len:207 (+) Transcript_61323:48-668(+)|eukprot:CAMPEP_0172500162 /NCGR_PEP_ID=MMETSP1066-20121228/135256_1 /TAXON_ID=671091 /ORGANISM="Coscinodiscus wailesii, Strain CCMP2513" /LENGTH=206 /DNA_ID=CAMNT_0013274265 /DNA_START=47 /DNA_END=667 /DNA_ORIENTATION=+
MGNLSTRGANRYPPLQPVPTCDTARFMGTWFVIGNKPTLLERTASNAVEIYTWDKEPKPRAPDIRIDFKMNRNEPIVSKLISLPQKGWIQSEDKSTASEWRVSPVWPVKLPYVIIELDDENYEYCVIGYPNREYAWIMARKPQMDDMKYKMICEKLKSVHKYDLAGLRKVPHKWTKEERARRGLENEIPDDMLWKEDAEEKKDDAA